MEIKLQMHTVSNRIAFLVLFPIFAFFGYITYRDAANIELGIFGVIVLALLFLFTIWVFLFRLCVFDYAIFREDKIELYSPFKKKTEYAYADVMGCRATYTSIIERKEYVTFTDKKYNSAVSLVDTSKRGNAPKLNQMRVIYVPATKTLLEFLQTRADLTWYRG